MQIVGIFLALAIGRATTGAAVCFPAAGRVAVHTQSPKLNRTTRAYVSVRRGKQELTRFDFEMARHLSAEQVRLSPFPARLTVVNASGIESPLVVATAGTHGGSDASFETMVIAEAGGSIREVSERIWTTTQDAVCMNRAMRRPEIVVLTNVWGHEAHYAPHVFTLRRYRWDGTTFRQTTTQTTRRKVASWRRAAKELRVSCRTDLTELLVPDER